MDQQHCAHERVSTYSFIEDGFVHRVCDKCGERLNHQPRVGPAKIEIRHDADGSVLLKVPADWPGELVVAAPDLAGGWRGVWTIRAGAWGPSRSGPLHPPAAPRAMPAAD